ncbi:hypothetical protein DPMN_123717 [Dreissena polymorpha]|uniref:Uncharacterized protein n=1 Tax=Dreissena polymorpha TaxID=45954 RepID=A0A9D4GRF0_DREPO|nr:hypothetical protein DPMN_123717 [Dreissena polymorpha]
MQQELRADAHPSPLVTQADTEKLPYYRTVVLEMLRLSFIVSIVSNYCYGM